MATPLNSFPGGFSYIDPQSTDTEIRNAWAELQRSDPQVTGERIFNEKRSEILQLMKDRGIQVA